MKDSRVYGNECREKGSYNKQNSSIEKSFPQKWEFQDYKPMVNFYVYILASKKNGVLYIGLTNELERRLYEHKNKVLKGFTYKYNVDKLVYYEEFETYEEAFTRERRLKKWNRNWKIRLIEKENSEWDDLSAGWF